MNLKTVDDIKHEFSVRGLTVTEWARHMGFSPGLVYQVLAGRLLCKRGQSHRIAVELGLKSGVVGKISDLQFIKKEEVSMKTEKITDST